MGPADSVQRRRATSFAVAGACFMQGARMPRAQESGLSSAFIDSQVGQHASEYALCQHVAHRTSRLPA